MQLIPTLRLQEKNLTIVDNCTFWAYPLNSRMTYFYDSTFNEVGCNDDFRHMFKHHRPKMFKEYSPFKWVFTCKVTPEYEDYLGDNNPYLSF